MAERDTMTGDEIRAIDKAIAYYVEHNEDKVCSCQGCRDIRARLRASTPEGSERSNGQTAQLNGQDLAQALDHTKRVERINDEQAARIRRLKEALGPFARFACGEPEGTARDGCDCHNCNARRTLSALCYHAGGGADV